MVNRRPITPSKNIDILSSVTPSKSQHHQKSILASRSRSKISPFTNKSKNSYEEFSEDHNI